MPVPELAALPRRERLTDLPPPDELRMTDLLDSRPQRVPNLLDESLSRELARASVPELAHYATGDDIPQASKRIVISQTIENAEGAIKSLDKAQTIAFDLFSKAVGETGLTSALVFDLPRQKPIQDRPDINNEKNQRLGLLDEAPTRPAVHNTRPSDNRPRDQKGSSSPRHSKKSRLTTLLSLRRIRYAGRHHNK